MEKRVLSIQSWVCHGYVGNKCSVFALQSLGIEVDPINTVHFSNNTGYPTWKGTRLDGDQLMDIIQGLEENDLLDYSSLLTGYVSSPSSLKGIVSLEQKLRLTNPDLIFVCDPVMGDNGRLYVPQELVQIYRDQVIPRAQIICPNQTECEVLTGTKISTEKEAIKAIDILHSAGPSTVIITSLFHQNSSEIVLLGSTTKNGTKTRFKISVPRLPFPFTGTGDLFSGRFACSFTTSALLLGWIEKGEEVIPASEKAINSVHHILVNTCTLKSSELRLIQNQACLVDPPKKFCAEILSE